MNYQKEQQELLINEFINTLFIQRNLSPKTLYAYRHDLLCMSGWFAAHGYRQITEAGIRDYFSCLQNEQHLSPRSVRRKYVSIRQYCQYLQSALNLNQSFFTFSARKFQLPRTLPKTLSMGEIKDLISAPSLEFQSVSTDYKRRLSIRNMCLIELLFCLGLRIGELSALDLGDYNREENTLLIRGKGYKERMLFISSPIVCQKLNLWLGTREELHPRDDAIFLNHRGSRLGIYGIEKVFCKYRQMAGINPHSTPHYLRHSFATQLLNNGANIRDVQELMGHNSIATTQIYTEVSVTRKKEILEKYNGRNFIRPL